MSDEQIEKNWKAILAALAKLKAGANQAVEVTMLWTIISSEHGIRKVEEFNSAITWATKSDFLTFKGGARPSVALTNKGVDELGGAGRRGR